MWAATQWVAWKLGFEPQLGYPWFELTSGAPIYLPPAFFWWWYAYDAYASDVFVEGAYIAASGGFISIAVAIGMSVWRAREAKTAATYDRLPRLAVLVLPWVRGRPFRFSLLQRHERTPFVSTTTSASNGGSKGSSNEGAEATFVRDISTLAHPRHGSLPRQPIVPARQCSI